MEKKMTSFFEKFLTKDSLFMDKKVLQANYTPNKILHREQEIEQIAHVLAPALRLEKPSNLFIYGKTGTGKTVCVKYTTNNIAEVASKNKIPLRVVYINCKLKRVADTEYRLIAQLATEFGKAIPATGLPTDEVYKIFFSALDSKEQIIILILDEIDQLAKKAGDAILYNLTRINEELSKAQLSIIGISNDLVFVDNLDPRVKSSLSEEEILFPPYNALQIQDILYERAKRAFKNGALGEGVIEKCAAYAAREHGDARRALELLRVAAEIAERKGLSMVSLNHIDEAEEKIERERILDAVQTQPKQFQVVLYSVLKLSEKNKPLIFTGEIYDFYKSLCDKINLRPLTQRRVSDVLAELDMLGIINAKVISKGRYGRTREITISTAHEITNKLKELLEKSLELS
jgi:cell division control protein 6